MDLSLHEPMYYFLCMLAMTDLGLSTSIVPKSLSIFWFNSSEIDFSACLTQLYFIHCFIAIESVFHIPALYFSFSGRFDKKKPHPVQILIAVMYYVMPPMLHPIIYDSNTTKVINPSTFILQGIPGLETADVWIAIPFCTIYIVTLLGNFTILCIVKMELSLHGPMYYFLCMLAMTDLVFHIPGLYFSLSGRFDKKKPHPVQVLIANMYYVMPPSLNPIIYGVRTKQIRNRMLHFFVHKGA
ncbi:olfactory receptor 52E4-like [Pelodiscus sinensis]|uniref:olfactory receptor 52E4-like n=1 Tax=Pelodiscus sinensis TaxID=13735 RepID=UPI003F6C7375